MFWVVGKELMQTGNSKYKTEVTESITKDTNLSLHFFSPVLSGLCRRAVSLARGGSLAQKKIQVWGHTATAGQDPKPCLTP